MQNPLFWEVSGIYFQIKYMRSRLNHEYSLSMHVVLFVGKGGGGYRGGGGGGWCLVMCVRSFPHSRNFPGRDTDLSAQKKTIEK